MCHQTLSKNITACGPSWSEIPESEQRDVASNRDLKLKSGDVNKNIERAVGFYKQNNNSARAARLGG